MAPSTSSVETELPSGPNKEKRSSEDDGNVVVYVVVVAVIVVIAIVLAVVVRLTMKRKKKKMMRKWVIATPFLEKFILMYTDWQKHIRAKSLAKLGNTVAETFSVNVCHVSLDKEHS